MHWMTLKNIRIIQHVFSGPTNEKPKEVDYLLSLDFSSILYTGSEAAEFRERKYWLAWYASSCCVVKMVCLFPMSECTEQQSSGPSPQLQRPAPFGYARYEILAQWDGQAKEEIRCRAATGPFGPHYNGSISSFSPLWTAAAPTMSQGWRPASCQAVSTPFSATLWPTPQSALRLHCARGVFVMDK